MRSRWHLVLALVLIAAVPLGCGGSSGSGNATGGVSMVEAPSVAASEGWILNAAVLFPGTEALSIGDTPSDLSVVGILGFDIGALTGVESAVLTIYRESLANDPWSLGPLLVDHIDGGGTLDPTDASVAALTEAAYVLPMDQPSWTLDVTALVAADRAAGRTTTTVRLRFDVPTNNDGVFDQLYIGTSQHTNTMLRPTLVVAQPAP